MSMRRIVACGGEDFTSLLPLIEAGLDLTGAAKPNVLLIPTAATSQVAHDAAHQALAAYGTDHGLPVRVLHQFGQTPPREKVIELLGWADALYVSPGDARRMLKRWVDWSIAELLRDTVNAGEVTAIGAGAGSVPWFTEGFSDADRYYVSAAASWLHREIDGLGNLAAVGCPGYDTLHPQSNTLVGLLFQRYLRSCCGVGTVGVGAEANVAMQVAGDTVTALSNGKPGLLHRLEVTGENRVGVMALMPGEEAPLSLFIRTAV